MSATNPANTINRWSVVGMEAMWVKMWDPPKEDPATPDRVAPTNPVPEVMRNAGYMIPQTGVAPNLIPPPHTVRIDLMHGMDMATWEPVNPKRLNYFLFLSPDIPATINGSFPGATVRMPNGVIFHCMTNGKGPPPHTIHWHGMEPTPMNDGVGHCSMEVGSYTYQWQPNFLGTYFAHCHRNTVQHFEFGLYFLLLVEPADTYFATLVDPTIPIGHCRDGKRRVAASLANFPEFPGWVGGNRTDPDPWTGDTRLKMENLHPLTGDINPHAQTVPFDVEGLWVFDDRDSVWSDLADGAHDTFPAHGDVPGVDDDFTRNPGNNDFFAFNDFNADYWFVTGVPVPCARFGTAAIPAGVVIPPELNSGITGSQVSIEAYVGQTILIRCLDAAYNSAEYKFPVDIVIIAWDGRALGVPPYGYNEAYLVPANTPIRVSVARRFDALIRVLEPFSGFATCDFIDTRGENVPGFEQVLCTAQVPINISALKVAVAADKASPQPTGTAVIFTASMPGNPGSQAPTSGYFEFQFWLWNGSSWELVQDYGVSDQWILPDTTLPGDYTIQANIRPVGSSHEKDASARVTNFRISSAAAESVDLTADPSDLQTAGNTVTFTAVGHGSTSYEYEFHLWNGSLWALAQAYGPADSWVMPDTTPDGLYTIQVNVRGAGSTAEKDASARITNYRVVVPAASGVDLTATPADSQTAGDTVSFHAVGHGSTNYEYEFWLWSGLSWELVQPYSALDDTWVMPDSTLPGLYTIQVNVRGAGSSVEKDAMTRIINYEITP